MMPMGDSIPSCLSFEDFLVTLRVLESSGESMPDAFLAFLRGKVVYSTEHSLTIIGDSITDSVVLLCARTFDTLKPLPGSSKDGDSIIPLICNLVGVSASSLPSVVGSGTGCSTGVSIPCLLSLPPPLLVSLAFLLFFFSSRSSSCVVSSCLFWSCSSSSSSAFVVRLSSSFPFPVAIPVTPPVAPAVFPPSHLPSFTPLLFPPISPVRPCLPSLPPGPCFPFGPSVASSSSFSVSSLLSSDPPASSSFFLSVPLSSVASSLPPSGLSSAPPVVCSGSSAPTLSWFLPSYVFVFCFFYVSSGSFPGSSCVLYGLLSSFLFSSLVPPVALIPLSSLALHGSLASSFAHVVPHPPADTSAGPNISSSLGGTGAVPSRTESIDVHGISGASFKFADPLHFRDGNDPFGKGAAESHPLG